MKRPSRRTLQTTAYTEPKEEPDAQPHIQTVRLTNVSRDEYQNWGRSDQTETDTELEAEDIDIQDDDTAPGTPRNSRTADRRQTNTRGLTLGVLTISGLQRATSVRCTPAAPQRIIQDSEYTPPAFTSVCTVRTNLNM